jgi:hypothetical protein
MIFEIDAEQALGFRLWALGGKGAEVGGIQANPT